MLRGSALDSSFQNSHSFTKQPIFFPKQPLWGVPEAAYEGISHCLCTDHQNKTNSQVEQRQVVSRGEFQVNWVNPREWQMFRAGDDFPRRWALIKCPHKTLWALLVGLLGCPGQNQHSLILVERIIPAWKIP